jgi:CubicO group peptidase (beta-lactamase class C family)
MSKDVAGITVEQLLTMTSGLVRTMPPHMTES